MKPTLGIYPSVRSAKFASALRAAEKTARNSRERTWVLVLATAETGPGESVSFDTRPEPVPKQFSIVSGDRSPFEGAIERALKIAPRERICVTVAMAHRPHWQSAVARFNLRNVLEQPRQLGTAIDILVAVLRILERDPWSRIVVMPAEPYAHDDAALAKASTRRCDDLTLIGVEREAADTDQDIILPGRWLADGTRSVYRVIHRPDAPRVNRLLACGALWDSHIFVARAVTLLGMLRLRLPDLVDQTETALARPDNGEALGRLYERLPAIDFSRVILQGVGSGLRVITASQCVSDRGVPEHVVSTHQGRPAAQGGGCDRTSDVRHRCVTSRAHIQLWPSRMAVAKSDRWLAVTPTRVGLENDHP